MGFSSNAIMAKSRALYGKRLKKEDYEALVNCRNVGEIVSYLKSETAYSSTFEKANSNIGTTQIEELLKIHVLKAFEKVSRYEISTGAQFYKNMLMKNDIQQILRFLHFLITDKPEEYLKVLPPFFNERSELDLYKLAGSHSYSEMLSALYGTPYGKVLKPFESTYKDPLTYLQMELALDKKLWETEKSIVEKYKGKSKQKLSQIIAFKNDMENLTRIYRLKRIAGEDKTAIVQFLNLNFTNFTKKDIDSMLEAETAREMLGSASESYYKKYFTKYSFESLEDFTAKILYDKFHKEIRYSTDPVIVMISYFFLAENEVKNIIHIVEGIRYGMSPEAISTVLVGTKD